MGAVAARRSADYVVVGAGAAGCVVAGRLSEHADQSVVLLEAGGERRGLITKVPSTAFLASVSQTRNWNYVSEPVEALNGRRVYWNQGRILGGSGSINGMLYMRGHPREFDLWRQKGCVGWSGAELLPYFRKCETNARGAGEWHGDAGPIPIRPSQVDLPICEAFLEAMRAGGYPLVDDLNTGVVEGFGRYDTNIRGGKRVSTANGYIDPAMRRPNFGVICDALATRLVIEGGRVRGVEILRGGVRETVYAEREVILCGGAYNSAQLLMLSGIGPADHLAEHGIAVVVDAPEVGQNLRNHAAYRLAYSCSAPVTAYKYLSPWRAPLLALRYAATGGGPLGESYIATGGTFRSDPALELADMIVVMAPALVTRGVTGSSIRSLFPQMHGFAVSVSLGRPQSSGEVRLRSADPTAKPLLFANYFADPADMRAMVRAVRRMRELLRAPSIQRFVAAELEPGPDVGEDEAAIEADIRAKGGTFHHPSGTCRMGADERAVVDPQLRVRGVAGLRIADNSIMPTALSACTHGPAIMIGERAASLIDPRQVAVVEG